MKRLFVTFALLVASTGAIAGDARQCFVDIAARFDIPPVILATVIRTEGCWNGFEQQNKNGSYDLGLMCVNTIHLPMLEPLGVTRRALRDDPCTSLAVGGYLLALQRRSAERDAPLRAGESNSSGEARWWAVAIGWYHSRTPHLAARYRGRARDHLQLLVKQLQTPP